MSDREFENYLALLSGLLGLSKRRQGQIAEELRAHLDDRLDDLLDQGLPRDEAVGRALAEFGDAANLAAELTQTIRQQRRRWIMRTTLKSSLAVAGVMLIAMALWPVDRPGVVAVSGAQQIASEFMTDAGKQRAKQPKMGGRGRRAAPAPPAQSDEEKNSQETRKLLAARGEFLFDEVSVRDVISAVVKQSRIQVHVSPKADEMLDALVTMRLNARLDMALNLALRNAELDYVIRDGIVMISTLEDLAADMEMRIYNCRDLLSATGSRGRGMAMQGMGAEEMDEGFAGGAFGGGEGGGFGGAFGDGAGGFGDAAGEEMEDEMGGGMGGMGMGFSPSSRSQLVTLIMGTVEPNSWNDGTASVTEFRGLLVVKHHAKAHEQVALLLQMLREADQSQPGFRSQRAAVPRSAKRAKRTPGGGMFGAGGGEGDGMFDDGGGDYEGGSASEFGAEDGGGGGGPGR